MTIVWVDLHRLSEPPDRLFGFATVAMDQAQVIVHIGCAGVDLDPDVVDKSMAFVDSAEPGIRTSMQRDVEGGRRSELESMVGVIGRKGRELGVPTPTADFVYAALLPGEQKAISK